ncbi:hypothetical protein Q5P01_003172 [Channa striata]|uniref:Uncharacterized protein n=1 Tax=Channa striata TaxID=64152 RepID=A0AA88NSZ2_CHASR|nr:hypothetical protein Q5P01_003172 [Channa striata]
MHGTRCRTSNKLGRAARTGRGTVLPESQSRFLEEVVALSPLHSPSAVQPAVPAPRPEMTLPMTPVTAQQPVKVVQPATLGEEGSSVSVSVPLLTRVTCSVATMTEGKPVSPSSVGEVDKGDVGFRVLDHGSAKVQRSQRRIHVPSVHVDDVAEHGPLVGTRETHLLEGEELLDLDLTPTLVPEVQFHTQLVHTAQNSPQTAAPLPQPAPADDPNRRRPKPNGNNNHSGAGYATPTASLAPLLPRPGWRAAISPELNSLNAIPRGRRPAQPG